MKNLPLISSTFELFDWLKSNGNATAEQTQKAYETITSNGTIPIINFNYVVWNDLVDKLYSALNEAEISWDSTYGTYQETRMTGLMQWTAKRFNAVAYNIEILINNVWKWEINKDVTGYLGRARMKGVKEVGLDKADTYYGWYIEELARVLNTFIGVLKNDSDYIIDLEHLDIINTTYQVPLLAQDSLPIEPQSMSFTIDEVQLLSLQTIVLSAYCFSNSIDIAELTTLPIINLQSDEITKSIDKVDVQSLEVLALSHEVFINTIHEAILNTPTSEPIEISHISKSRDKVEVVTPTILNIEHEYISNTIYEVEVRTPQIDYVEIEEINKSIEQVDLMSLVSDYVQIEKISNSIEYVELINSIPEHLEIGNISTSIEDVEVNQVPSNPFEIENISTSIDGLEINQVPSNPFEIENISNSIEELELSFAESIPLNIANFIRTICRVELTLEQLETEWLYPIQSGTDLYIQQVYDGYKENTDLYIDTEIWLAPIQNGTDLYIRQLYNSSKEDDQVKGE